MVNNRNYDIWFVYSLCLPNGQPFYYRHTKDVGKRIQLHKNARNKARLDIVTTRQVIEAVETKRINQETSTESTFNEV